MPTAFDIPESTPTPLYYYDLGVLNATLDAVLSAACDYKVHYAVKANNNSRILEIIAKRGLGADCVSGGEIRQAMDAGIKPADMVYSGVGKTDGEIDFALTAGIGCFNVESIEELDIIASRAEALGTVASVALRINPDIDAHTHEYITTGLAENKFGIPWSRLVEAVDVALSLRGLRLRGLHFHIGSQVTVNEPWQILCERANSMLDALAARGVSVDYVNMGGGLGIDYDDPDANPIPDFKSYFDTFRRCLRVPAGARLHFELGRSIVAQCGSLISRVILVKGGVDRDFVILDAGMNNLIRPALYGAHHVIQNLSAPADAPCHVYDVVGPVCESADVFGNGVELPLTRRGDIMAIRSVGAYGEVMSSAYNSRPVADTLFVSSDSNTAI